MTDDVGNRTASSYGGTEAREFLIESIFMMRRTAIELRRRADKLDALSFDLGAVLGAESCSRIRSPGAPPGP